MLESLEVKDNPLGSRDYWSLNRLPKRRSFRGSLRLTGGSLDMQSVIEILTVGVEMSYRVQWFRNWPSVCNSNEMSFQAVMNRLQHYSLLLFLFTLLLG